MGKLVEFEARNCGDGHAGWAQINCVSNVPNLPILPETLLAVELMAKESCASLSDISALLRKDIGAVARIFYCATRELGIAENRPTRIEDCVSILGAQKCLEALTCLTVAWSSARAVIHKAWRHGAQVAECCMYIASETGLSLHVQDAYMVGLFHELDGLTANLNWESELNPSDIRAGFAVQLAEDWGLPAAVAQYLREMRSESAHAEWHAIVDRAHELIA